jgi:hypothetical protein
MRLGLGDQVKPCSRGDKRCKVLGNGSPCQLELGADYCCLPPLGVSRMAVDLANQVNKGGEFPNYFRLIGYEPHPKQWLYHNSKARFRVAVCGRRFGKSRMVAAARGKELFKPGTRGWIIGPTYDLGEKEFRYMWDDIVVKLKLGSKIHRKAYNVRSGEMYIEMPWGSRVDVKSADHPDGLVGEGLDWVIMSEAAKHKRATWEKYVRPALADRRGSADFATTPEGFNWIYDLYQIGRDPNNTEYEAWRFPSWDNPVVYPGGRNDPEILLQETSESAQWFSQEIAADFTTMVGQIYSEWDDDVHIIDEWKFRPDLPNYCFFDFGYVNPFVCLEAQLTPSDELIIWREYYKPLMPVPRHIIAMKEREQPDGYHITCGFGDAADPGAVATLSEDFCPTYAEPDAKKDWNQGIQEVKKLLMHGERTTESGIVYFQKPRIYVVRGCRNTIYEVNNYRTKETKNADARDNKKETPAEVANHSMDAIRYGVVHLFVLGAKYHLSDVFELNPIPRRSSAGDISLDHQREEDFFGGLGQVGGMFTMGGERF